MHRVWTILVALGVWPGGSLLATPPADSEFSRQFDQPASSRAVQVGGESVWALSSDGLTLTRYSLAGELEQKCDLSVLLEKGDTPISHRPADFSVGPDGTAYVLVNRLDPETQRVGNTVIIYPPSPESEAEVVPLDAGLEGVRIAADPAGGFVLLGLDVTAVRSVEAGYSTGASGKGATLDTILRVTRDGRQWRAGGALPVPEAEETFRQFRSRFGQNFAIAPNGDAYFQAGRDRLYRVKGDGPAALVELPPAATEVRVVWALISSARGVLAKIAQGKNRDPNVFGDNFALENPQIRLLLLNEGQIFGEVPLDNPGFDLLGVDASGRPVGTRRAPDGTMVLERMAALDYP